MRARGDKWDAKDRRLREVSEAGRRVLPYKRLVISSMLELFSRGWRLYWRGGCVADLTGSTGSRTGSQDATSRECPIIT